MRVSVFQAGQNSWKPHTFISQDTDFLGLSDVNLLSSTPLNALYNISPVPFPNASHKMPFGFFTSSLSELVLSLSTAFCLVELPNPWRSLMSSGSRIDRRSSGTRRNEFAGLAFRDAIRERIMFQEIPMLTFGSISTRNQREK